MFPLIKRLVLSTNLEIRKLSDEEARCEVKASEEPTLNAISGSEVIEDTEYLDWYENWKKENFNNEKK